MGTPELGKWMANPRSGMAHYYRPGAERAACSMTSVAGRPALPDDDTCSLCLRSENADLRKLEKEIR